MLSQDIPLYPVSSEPTDPQLSMSFWAHRDPNLRYLPVSLFQVDARLVGELLNTLTLPSRPSNEVELHIAKNMLTARVEDLTGAAWMQGSVQLEGDAIIDLGGLTIVADRQMLTRLGKLLCGCWSFRYDRNAHELSWTNENYKAQCKAVERVPQAATQDKAGYRLSGKLVGDSIQYATTLRPRRLSDERTYHGARICNGFAMGGYMHGTSQAVSSEIPNGLEFGIPHAQLNNVVHILRAMGRACSIVSEDDAVSVESVHDKLRGGLVQQRGPLAEGAGYRI